MTARRKPAQRARELTNSDRAQLCRWANTTMRVALDRAGALAPIDGHAALRLMHGAEIARHVEAIRALGASRLLREFRGELQVGVGDGVGKTPNSVVLYIDGGYSGGGVRTLSCADLLAELGNSAKAKSWWDAVVASVRDYLFVGRVARKVVYGWMKTRGHVMARWPGLIANGLPALEREDRLAQSLLRDTGDASRYGWEIALAELDEPKRPDLVALRDKYIPAADAILVREKMLSEAPRARPLGRSMITIGTPSLLTDDD